MGLPGEDSFNLTKNKNIKKKLELWKDLGQLFPSASCLLVKAG